MRDLFRLCIVTGDATVLDTQVQSVNLPMDFGSFGILAHHAPMLCAVSKGVLREDAYKWVQRNAMKRWLEGEDFRSNVERDEEIGKYLTRAEIDACFDVNWYLRRVDEIYARFGL